MPDRIDEFESYFRSADKPALAYRRLRAGSILVVTDLDPASADRLAESVRRFLSALESDRPAWASVGAGDYQRVDDLLARVDRHAPDLIVTYRNLQEAERGARVSLGVFLDELTQNTPVPVLVLPRDADRRPVRPRSEPKSVMVVTDHLTGDSLLVDYGARLTAPDGVLILAHIEDGATFDRYMAEIAKIPELETELVRRRLREQLLKEPRDYVESCIRVLREAGLSIRIEREVAFGQRLRDYRRLVETHAVELLILHTRRQSRPAMRGMGCLIAAEFRQVPLLLL